MRPKRGSKAERILTYIRKHPDQRIRDIAEKMDCAPGTVSRVAQDHGIRVGIRRPRGSIVKVALTGDLRRWVDRESRLSKVSRAEIVRSVLVDVMLDEQEA